MDIVGDRKFVEVPGGKTHDFPPLLVKTVPEVKRLDKMMGIAAEIIEQEDMVPTLAAPFRARKICWSGEKWTWR